MLPTGEPEHRRPRAIVGHPDDWAEIFIHVIFDCDESTAEKFVL